MSFVYYLQIHFMLLCGLDILEVGWPDYGFVNIKQLAFLQIFVSPQALFLFSKHLDTMTNLTDGALGQTDLWKDLYLLKAANESHLDWLAKKG